jgi:hypothetical protein
MPSMMDHDADNLKFDIQEETRLGTRIRVLGVGGGGSNAVNAHDGGGGPRRRFLRPEHRPAGAGGLTGAQ